MNVTKTELESILKENDLVVVDFWASWCGPCRFMTPIFEKFAENNPDVKIVKVEADQPENEGVAQVYGIRGIPAIVYFKDGTEVGRLMGHQTVEELQKKLDAYV